MIRFPVTVAFISALSASQANVGHAQEVEKEKLAVMPLAAKRFPQESVEILDELLLNGLHRRGKHKVIGAADINAMLGFEKMRSALGCDDLACAAEIGGALGVEMLISGSVSKLGDQVIVSLTLINIARNDVANRSQISVEDNERLYRYAIDAAVAGLLGEPEPPKPIASEPAVATPPPAVPPQLATPAVVDDVDSPPSFGVQFMSHYIPTQGSNPEQSSVLVGPRFLARIMGPLHLVVQAGYAASGREPGYGRHGLILGGGVEIDFDVRSSPRLTVLGRVTYDLVVTAFNEKDAFPTEQYDFDSALIVAAGVRFMNVVEVSALLGQRYFPGFGGGVGIAVGYMW